MQALSLIVIIIECHVIGQTVDHLQFHLQPPSISYLLLPLVTYRPLMTFAPFNLKHAKMQTYNRLFLSIWLIFINNLFIEYYNISFKPIGILGNNAIVLAEQLTAVDVKLTIKKGGWLKAKHLTASQWLSCDFRLHRENLMTGVTTTVPITMKIFTRFSEIRNSLHSSFPFLSFRPLRFSNWVWIW